MRGHEVALPVLISVLGIMVGACASGGPGSARGITALASPAASSRTASTPPAALTIYGAASLKWVLEAAKTAYEAANPGTTLTISTDSSATLETQIEQGAPADVFLSADSTNPKKLLDKGLADGAAVTFA